MVGLGTTAIEAKLLNRNLIACDINPDALERTRTMTEFSHETDATCTLKLNDARNLERIDTENIDFVLTHPPYADIVKYSDGIAGDLSQIHDINEFCEEMGKVARECYRVLKPGKFCAILIGDTRRKKMYQPMAFGVMSQFLNAGFALKEDIVKVQHNCKATGFWVKKSQEANFLLIMHEHLFIFQKL